ncbi:MAG: N-acetyl-alpha-D-glucosaminyl L-malate synthase BshA, partial [Anaerolineae bacterium]|nr:N-acetyl-alpha-D-glucosaminyl L-malate synthase BshA [Anaerolineae bacterium]
YGHQIHLFSRSAPFDTWDQADGIIPHYIVPQRENSLHPAALHTAWTAGETQALLDQILKVIEIDGLDILHFHYADPFALVAAALKQRLGPATPKLVGTLHGTDVVIQGRDPHKGPQLASALRQADALTTVSINLAGLATYIFDLPALPRVIPNFVDLSRFHISSRHQDENNLKNGCSRKPRIVHISNFRPVKNPQRMAHIFMAIREQIDAELWLIGDGQEMAQVQAIFQQNDLEQRVRYCGLQPNVGPLLRQADLLLMTSQYESFCLAALEAMACGIPVLATHVGGLPEVVRHEETGYLFPIDDHAAAVAWAVQILSNRAQYEVIRQNAITHAQRFGEDHIVPMYESLYRRLLAERSPIVAHELSIAAYPTATVMV